MCSKKKYHLCLLSNVCLLFGCCICLGGHACEAGGGASGRRRAGAHAGIMAPKGARTAETSLRPLREERRSPGGGTTGPHHTAAMAAREMPGEQRSTRGGCAVGRSATAKGWAPAKRCLCGNVAVDSTKKRGRKTTLPNNTPAKIPILELGWGAGVQNFGGCLIFLWGPSNAPQKSFVKYGCFHACGEIYIF